MFVLDTNTLIYFSRGETAAADFILGGFKRGEKFLISIITLVEFLSYPTITQTEQSFFSNMLTGLDVRVVDFPLAMRAVAFRKMYRLKLGDSIVAAVAFANGATLVSRDKDFKKIKEIEALSL
jgi:predicted nucleic acid-binding protein